MLTAITYNCDPESLGDMGQSEFVDAFENEVRVKPIYRDLKIAVTFDSGKSGLTSITSTGDSPSNAVYEEFGRFAEKAFAAICE